MTANTFLAELDRFISRRGMPTDMYNDNGLNFVRATSEMLKYPPFGVMWESNIKRAKGFVECIVRNKTPTFEELSTVFARIEAVVNSRLLVALSDGSIV